MDRILTFRYSVAEALGIRRAKTKKKSKSVLQLEENKEHSEGNLEENKEHSEENLEENKELSEENWKEKEGKRAINKEKRKERKRAINKDMSANESLKKIETKKRSSSLCAIDEKIRIKVRKVNSIHVLPINM